MNLAKLLSAAMVSSSILAACSEDDTHLGTHDASLKVSTAVKTESVTRAVFTGTDMGAGQKIGVSIFNADGSDYNGQHTGFKNILYTSDVINGRITWSTKTPVILTPTTGKAVAYYPYTPDANIEALPVETASVTDYLYSDWVEGLNSTKTNADFMMNHALSAIRINFHNESYTGAGTVSKVAVKSAELGTAAMLNAKTGALSSITGKGSEIVSTDLFTLPKGSQTHTMILTAVPAGGQSDITLTVTMDGKAYHVPVKATAPFLQGEMYTINIKAKDKVSPFEVSSVTVKPWNNKYIGDYVIGQETKPAYLPDEYAVKVKIPSNNFVFNSNVSGFTGTIDWGDGTISETMNAANNPTHTYTAAGIYTIRHKGAAGSLTYNDTSHKNSAACISDILFIGNELNLTSMYNAFINCVNLSKLNPDILHACYNVTDFTGTFAGCTGLTAIPDNLFKTAVNAKYFDSTFQGCTKLATIPASLFSFSRHAERFSKTFEQCTSLQIIPQGLFANNPSAIYFSNVFCATAIRHIPNGLFHPCTAAKDFEMAFYKCKSLIAIPQNLFDNNRQVTNFNSTFKECTQVGGESPFTLIGREKVHIYERNKYQAVFANPMGYECYWGAANLTDYTSIPADWK